MAYPLDQSVFPSNLSPIYAHIGRRRGSIARLNFQATGVNVNYYANCSCDAQPTIRCRAVAVT